MTRRTIAVINLALVQICPDNANPRVENAFEMIPFVAKQMSVSAPKQAWFTPAM